MKTNHLLFALLPLVVLSVSSCVKDVNLSNEVDLVGNIPYNAYGQSTCPVYFVGSAEPDYLDQALRERLAYVVSTPDDAKAIVVNSTQMDANKEMLKKAWKERKIIVEVKPDNAAHNYFWTNELGESSYLDISEQSNDLLLIARNQGACYQLQNPCTTGDLVCEDGENEPEEADGTEPAGDERINITYEPVEIGETSEYLATKISGFVDWVNENSNNLDSQPTNVPTFIKDLYSKIEDANYTQKVDKPIPIVAKGFTICEVVGSDPDKVDRSTSLDLNLRIMPFHSYEKNNLHGDLYFITAHLGARNREMCWLYTKYHGAVKTYSHIFYSKNFELNAEILDSKKEPLTGGNVAFFETPVPATTQTSTEYNTGMSKSFNLAGQFGRNCGAWCGNITVGGVFTWSNSKTQKVSDLRIETSTSSTTRAVNYQYITENIKRHDEVSKAIPAIGRTDENCDATWCWHVPGAKDNDTTTRYYLRIKVIPHYGYMWRHLRWDCGGEKTAVLLKEKDGTFTIPLDIPKRNQEGVLDLKSTFSKYLTNVVLYDKNNKVVAKSEDTVSKDSIVRFQVPVGEYVATYEQRDGDDGHLEHKYKMEKIVIKTAETTVKSANQGVIVQ